MAQGPGVSWRGHEGDAEGGTATTLRTKSFNGKFNGIQRLWRLV